MTAQGNGTKMRPDNYWAFKARSLFRKVTRSPKPDYFTQMRWFTGSPMHEVMASTHKFSTIRRMPAASTVIPWPAGNAENLPECFELDSQLRATAAFLIDTDTAALVVLRDGAIVHETYMLNGGKDVAWLSMSVAKSFTSALVGIALADGLVASVDDPISDYVPVQPGSAYDGVSIKHVLQMSSGARWNEDYSDPDADVFRVGRAMAGLDGGFDGFVAQMSRDLPPNSMCRYNSGETQILGALVRAVTGRSLASYMNEKLVQPLGFERPGYWATDLLGTEMAYAGLNLVARDYARLGECYRNGGRFNGLQVIPEQWVKDSTTFDSPVRAPGRVSPDGSVIPTGYGYQWWLPDGNAGEFMAVGVLNQYIYVNPTQRVTIVKLSANRNYGTAMTEAANRGAETLAFLRAVASAG